MRKVKKIRILVIVLIAAFLTQAGYIAYSMLGDSLYKKEVAEADNTQATSTVIPDNNTVLPGNSANIESQLTDETSVEISQEILDLIKLSDPDNYTKNVDNYKQLLTKLNVHNIFKNEIERLIKQGNKLPDILVAYEFLNECYGSIADIEKLVKEKDEGEKWVDIFKAYNLENPEFKPREFDAEYLDKLLTTAGIDQDDIMIADRVSQKIKTEIDTVLNKRVEGFTWRLINAQYGIVNGLEKSPHLPVTREQLTKYTTQSKLTEKQVIEALVIASKLGKSNEDILKSMQQGLSKDDIYSSAYEEKYY